MEAKEGGDNMFLVGHEEGQGLLEYGLILVLVAVIVFAILFLLGPVIGNIYSTILNGLF
jgi:pilus assembly protein Flp/PilA